jgi:hypothetical protein
MKFEEVPVSNYTGIPDISIPLFSSSSHSKDINLDLVLKYHPSGIGANERASDVGLGWSLFGGGTISRTVRGLPDEILVMDDSNKAGKVGIYNTSIPNHNNYFYQHMQNFPNFVYQQPYAANEYLWDVVETGKFDTEQDLWQFNFMGKTGRFLIKKNIATNLLEVTPLDDYRIVINCNYNQTNFNLSSFTVFDEKGYKYIFDVVETTKNATATLAQNIYGDSDNISEEKEFKSAFHLSKIIDSNNKIIIEYNYDDASTESTTNSTITLAEYPNEGYSGYETYRQTNCFNEFKPLKRLVNSLNVVAVKKLSNINVIDFAKIDLNYTKGRLDTNLANAQNSSFLNQIIIKDWSNSIKKKIKLNYDYSIVLDKRLILKEIVNINNSDVSQDNFLLFYKINNSSGFNIAKDFWGYFNLVKDCENVDINFSNEPSPSFSTTDVLQKIKYPTGGSVIFDFEANQYSFEGNVSLSNFNENQDNFYQSYSNNFSFTNSSTLKNIPISSVTRKAKFYPSLIANPDPNMNSVLFSLIKWENNTWVNVGSLICTQTNANCCIDAELDPNIQYAIRRDNLDINYDQTDYVYVEIFSKTSSTKNFLYGGGNRIKQIAYFDANISQNYFEDITLQNIISPDKNKKFIYTLPSDRTKSSGSLVFPKPLFKYLETVSVITNCPEPPFYQTYGYYPERYTTYLVKTNFNNLPVIKTQGADVGYKNVEVVEQGMGKTVYEYTSPIEYPEEIMFSNVPPFLPSKNIDYKRGLVLKERVHNENDVVLKEITNTFDFENFEIKYGNRIYKPTGSCFNGSYFNRYSSYEPFLTQPPPYFYNISGQNVFSSTNLCGYPANYTQNYPLYEAYGWAKLSNRNTLNYYYTSGTNRTLETNESFVYNNLNKQIASQTTTSSLGETITTNYYYHTGNSIYSQNRISEIERVETLKSSQLTTESKINYSNSWDNNTSFLPNTIETKKGTSTSEIKIRYNKYDEFGNPLEAQQENGTKTSYIWGYNKTQPVAKIENLSYASISPSLIAAIETASASTGTEGQLLIELNNLRNSLPNNAMATTYTYKPLIGVSTITDPKNMTTYYEYDSSNRLSVIKDRDKNILQSYCYNYKGQSVNCNTNNTALVAPNGVQSTTVTASTISFSWNAVSGATGYKIYQNGVYISATTTTSGTLSGLSANTSYNVQVMADNASSSSPLSTAVMMTTNPDTNTSACSLSFDGVNGTGTFYKNYSESLTLSNSGTINGLLDAGDTFYVTVIASNNYYRGLTITSSIRGVLYSANYVSQNLTSDTFTKVGSEIITVQCTTSSQGFDEFGY